MTTHEQWESYQPNNRSFAYVIEKEVLNKGQRALVILGSGHVLNDTDSHLEPDTTMLVERARPGSMYVVIMSVSEPPQTRLPAPPVLLPWPVRLSNGQEIIAGAYQMRSCIWALLPIRPHRTGQNFEISRST